MEGYNHREIEKKWQERWEKEKIYQTNDTSAEKENFYNLFEFPYPSGNLHVGHWYAYIGPDIFARFMRMRGKNVLFPIGFDAFGLPAENAAIKRQQNPREWTYSNIEYMRKQFRMMGASVDWSREVVTCDPHYYKWTQWLFLQFFKKGLAYQADTPANWCPSCKTVLANEQVVGGKCERCGTDVEQRVVKQWNLRITNYAERLLADLEDLDWPEPIKEAQRQWIGRSEGAEIEFGIKNYELGIKVFTTRPDTLFGATYLVLAPEHKEISNLKSQITNWGEVAEYIKGAQKKTERERRENKEKTGIELQGITAINPANGKEIPVWVADYVLAGYGTGAIMAVPAHDERDFEFAKKFGLPVKRVVAWESGMRRQNEERRDGGVAVIFDPKTQKYAFGKTSEGLLDLFGGGVDGGEELFKGIKREVEEESGLHKFSDEGILDDAFVHYFNFKKQVPRRARATCLILVLEDRAIGNLAQEKHEDYQLLWLDPDEAISYWEHNDEDGDYAHWVKFLKRGVNWLVDEGIDTTHRKFDSEVVHTDEGILISSGEFDDMDSKEAREKITVKYGRKETTYRIRDWGVSRQRYWGTPIPVIHCSKCGVVAVPEEDLPVVLPEISDYMPRDDGKSPLAKVDSFVKTKCPKCGGDGERETDTLDTFVDSSWYFLRYTDPKNENEFASKEKMEMWMPVNFYSGGAEHTTMHLLYSRFFHKALFDMGLVKDAEPYVRRMNRGLILGPDGNKMSKSKGNVIDPDDVVDRLGADTVRTYLAFIGPYNEAGVYPWSPDSIVGVRRFIERVWRVVNEKVGKGSVGNTPLHRTIKNVTEILDRFKMNTAVSALMEFVNGAEKSGLTKDELETFLKLLAPFAPHVAEELWHQLGHTTSIHLEAWPGYDDTLLVEDAVTIVVQVNGKVRGEFETGAGLREAEAIERAGALPAVKKWVSGKPLKKTVYVPDRLVNLVLDA